MTNISDRIKSYEAREIGRTALRGLPIVVRLDGRAFHSFTRGMARPFDPALSALMVETAKFLVEQTHARIGYTQSDEISLILLSDGPKSDPLFGGRLFKLTSVLASMATARFMMGAISLWPEKVTRSPPVFDARVFEVPTREEAVNAIMWREWDATKNAISMAASAHFSPMQLHGKNGAEMQEMLFSERGINFNDYPAGFKRGTYVQRRLYEKTLDEETLARIPPGKRPTGPVMRSEVAVLELPPLAKVPNRVAVLMDAEPPARGEG